MSDRDHLYRASDLLGDAAARTADDTGDRLDRLATQIESAADRDSGPDHGRLARHLTALDELSDDVDNDTAATIDEARDHLVEFRKTVEGV